jgi:hypothetical protein
MGTSVVERHAEMKHSLSYLPLLPCLPAAAAAAVAAAAAAAAEASRGHAMHVVVVAAVTTGAPAEVPACDTPHLAGWGPPRCTK